MIIDKIEAKRVWDARQHLVQHFPFFATLTGRLKYEQAHCGTADVDGVTLRTDPRFTQTLSFPELVGVVAHEGGHCGLCHHARRGNRDPEVWNIACDLALNPLLFKAGLTLPKGALFDASLVDDKGRPLPAEIIYTRLKQQQAEAEEIAEDLEEDEGEGEGQGEDEDQDEDEASASENADEPQAEDETDEQAEGGIGTDDASEGDQVGGAPGEGEGEPQAPSYGGCGSFRDAPADAGQDPQLAQAEEAQKWEVAAMQAVAAAKGAGALPAYGEWLIENARAPKVDWRDVLRDFVQVRVRSEATWNRPNRRYIHQGTYLPSRDTKEMGEMVIVTDASGSCWGPMQEAFAAEINAVVEDVRPRLTHVLYWDTQCQGHEEHEPDDLPLDLTAKGGGGTVFEGIWPWIEEQGIEPTCVVVLTDLDVYGFGAEPDYPVLWCSTLRTTAPFGEVVELTL